MLKARNILYILLILLSQSNLYSQEYKGIVLRVIDGDTFVFQDENGSIKIRMADIDAPEIKQSYGTESKSFLQYYEGDSCRILTRSVDRYGRTIAVLFIDSTNINLLSIRTGNSWHYKYYSTDKEMADAENLAKTEKLGLWKNTNPIPPWEFRRKK